MSMTVLPQREAEQLRFRLHPAHQAGRAPGRFLDSRLNAALALGAILLLGLALRLHHLGFRSFWFDEAVSWRLIQFPIAELIETVGRDNNPPLHHLLLKGWAALFGDTPLALRALSVVCGLCTVLGVFVFMLEVGRSWLGQPAEARGLALLAAALAAFSVFHVRHSWEARMYPLATALLSWSVWALLRALRAEPARFGWWALWSLLSLLFAYAHTFAVFSLAGEVLFLAGWLAVRHRQAPRAAWRDPRTRHLVLAGLSLAAGYAPWLPVLLRQQAAVKGGFSGAEPTLDAWLQAFACLFYRPDFFAVGPMWSCSRPIALGCFGLVLAILAGLCWRPRAAAWLLLALAIVPFALCAAFAATGTAILNARYFAFAHVALLAGLATLVWRLPGGWARRSAAAALLAVFLGRMLMYSDFIDGRGQLGVQKAGELLAELAGPEEPVIVCAPFDYFTVRRYLAGKAPCLLAEQQIVPFLAPAVFQAEDRISPQELDQLAVGRCWVVSSIGPNATAEAPLPLGWEEEETYRFREHARSLNRVVVTAYRRSAPPSGE